MKRKLFLLQLIVISLLLNSCITRNWLWGSNVQKIDRDEIIKDLLINQDGNRLILIGTKYHYFIDDDKRTIKKLLLWDGKQKLETAFSLDAKGSKSELGILFVATVSDLTTEQQNFLRSFRVSNFEKKYDKKFGNGSKISARINLFGTRIKSELLQNNIEYKNFISTGLIKNHRKIDIVEKRSAFQTAGKTLLTPLTIAADIILLPLYLLGVLAMGIGSK